LLSEGRLASPSAGGSYPQGGRTDPEAPGDRAAGRGGRAFSAAPEVELAGGGCPALRPGGCRARQDLRGGHLLADTRGTRAARRGFTAAPHELSGSCAGGDPTVGPLGGPIGD